MLSEKSYNYMKDYMMTRAVKAVLMADDLIRQTEEIRDQQVKFYVNQAEKYEAEASHARILRVCLTGKPQ